jgi:hypothetical protein
VFFKGKSQIMNLGYRYPLQLLPAGGMETNMNLTRQNLDLRAIRSAEISVEMSN